MANQKVVLITGASKGIGLETVRLFASDRKNYEVYGTWNTTPVSEHVIPGVTWLQLDQTREDSIQKVFEKIQQQSGRLDILVNNAGMGVYGPLELLSTESIRKQFDVNLIGPLLMMKEALPLMRKNNFGRLINVSSIAGAVGFPLMDVYSGSKFGLEGTCAAMEGYLSRMDKKVDIHCQVIEPGFTRTDFRKASDYPEQITGLFEDLWQRFLAVFDHGITTGQSPVEVARVIRQMVENNSSHKPFRVPGNPDRSRYYEKTQGLDIDGHSLVVKKPLNELYP